MYYYQQFRDLDSGWTGYKTCKASADQNWLNQLPSYVLLQHGMFTATNRLSSLKNTLRL